ncbi:MAG: 30S ribosomal protein S2 [Planctomycetota bacterium]
MHGVPIKNLLEAGVHFGHRASRWNPKMAPFIFGKRNLIHIINLKETLRGLIQASMFLQGVASEGKQILFVGTKRQARNLVAEEAGKLGMPFVAERWLGGMLTNFETIRSRLRRLEELEMMATDGTTDAMNKKALARFLREKSKIYRNLHGIRNMSSLPGAMIVIDPRKEKTAVAEARKMGVPCVAILDTDCDPSAVDIGIPGNDDALRSIQVLLDKMTESIRNGKSAHSQFKAEEDKRRAADESKKEDKRKARVVEQKKRAGEQTKLDDILKKAREERAVRVSEEEGAKARQEEDTQAGAPKVADQPAVSTETKPGPAGPEPVEG